MSESHDDYIRKKTNWVVIAEDSLDLDREDTYQLSCVSTCYKSTSPFTYSGVTGGFRLAFFFSPAFESIKTNWLLLFTWKTGWAFGQYVGRERIDGGRAFCFSLSLFQKVLIIFIRKGGLVYYAFHSPFFCEPKKNAAYHWPRLC